MKRYLLLLLTYLFLTTSINAQDSTSYKNIKQDTFKSISYKSIPIKPIHLGLIPLHANANSYYTSFNLIGGSIQDVKIIEIGGIFNIVRNVQLLHIAGVFNWVKQSVNGIQIAGVYNFVGKDYVGIQAGGIGNITFGEFTGLQFGGLFNYTDKQYIGFQIGGIFNYSKSDNMGIQLSGGANITMGIGAGLQFSTLNIMKNYSGLEIGGLANITLENSFALSAAGVLNWVGKNFNGIQISMLNYVGKISNGLQIGLINYADSLNKGIALGLISIVRKGGYKAFELSSNNNLPLVVSYKNGTRKLYNIYSIGYHFSAKPLLSFGLGFGTKHPISSHIAFQPEAIVYSYFPPTFSHANYSLSINFNLGFAYDINSWISIIGAPTFYANIRKPDKDGSYPVLSLTRNFSSSLKNNQYTEFGFGYKIGCAIKL